MGTLYLVGVPATNANDLTLRAKRVLSEVTCIVVDDLNAVSTLPDLCGIATSLARTSDTGTVLRALEAGDVALLCSEHSPCPSAAGSQLVRSAVERGLCVVPVPGPVLPITALILSGLAADSFVFLAGLPAKPGARQALLTYLQSERRTVVITELTKDLPDLLSELYRSIGERPLALTRASHGEAAEMWRGTLSEVALESDMDDVGSHDKQQSWILVIGGASRSAGRWKVERLRTAVHSCLDRGLGVKETSQQLAAESGWSRRKVYRLALDVKQRRIHDSPAQNAPGCHTKT